MLKRITLHLARTPEFPEGSNRHGYEIIAPLDAEGRLDTKLFNAKKDHCRVRRFWGNEPIRYGRLEHRPGGIGGATWEIDYDDSTDNDDEAGYRLSSHKFSEGEYLSIRDDEGELNTFRVIKVQDA